MRWIDVGFDESMVSASKGSSNYPQVYVAVASMFPQDTELMDEESFYLKKQHKNHKNIFPLLKKRSYSYLFLENKKEISLPLGYRKLGIVLGSLLYDKPTSKRLNIYIDGEWGDRPVGYALDIVQDVTGLSRDEIYLHERKKHDKRRKIVNIADQAAHWILHRRHKRGIDVRHDPNCTRLRLNELMKKEEIFQMPKSVYLENLVNHYSLQGL